jgi:hypothetical protein
MKFAIICVFLVIISACSNFPQAQEWTGKPISALVEKSGPPSKTLELPDGEKEYIYETLREFNAETHGGYGVDTLSTEKVTCATTWYVNASGLIEGVHVSENRCNQAD